LFDKSLEDNIIDVKILENICIIVKKILNKLKLKIKRKKERKEFHEHDMVNRMAIRNKSFKIRVFKLNFFKKSNNV
jgi:hypothetical protein